jgi:hypothetical protein
MSAKSEKCEHPPCSCTPSAGSKYCSPYCESAKDRAEINCGCEHPGCAGRTR